VWIVRVTSRGRLEDVQHR